ncbi:unnamed protein product [Chrysoparadoxa australica]
MLNNPALVIDNGAGSVKAGFSGENEPRCVMPNCTARLRNQLQVLVGDEVDTGIRDKSQLSFQRPFDRGYLVNWETESEVWHRMFDSQHLKCNPADQPLIMTEAPFPPRALQEVMNEVIYEEFGFPAYLRCPGPALSVFYEQAIEDEVNQPAPTVTADEMVVVDAGFSFSHVYPFHQGRAIQKAVQRLNIGGKLMTNYLKEVVSYRQWNMMDEFELINQVKEALCFASLDFEGDLRSTRRRGRSSIAREFVLPDYKSVFTGFAREPGGAVGVGEAIVGDDAHQVLAMERERFSVPELLFNPSDIGIKQAGLAECVVASIAKCPTEIQPALYENILLTGGSANLPNFKERMQREVRSLAPDHCVVNVRLPDGCAPQVHAWRGGSKFGATPDYACFCVTRQEYQEHGHRLCDQKFSDW